MKTIIGAVTALLCLAGSAQGAAMQVCDVTVDVTDQDPKGTNVREAPGGRIVAVLPQPADDDWIEVHILGQSGDWFLIGSAKNVGDDDKTIFHGKGYLHRSVLGTEGVEAGAKVYADHDVKSRILDLHGAFDQRMDFLGCWNDFVKIRFKATTAWTKELCLNQRTTCS